MLSREVCQAGVSAKHFNEMGPCFHKCQLFAYGKHEIGPGLLIEIERHTGDLYMERLT